MPCLLGALQEPLHQVPPGLREERRVAGIGQAPGSAALVAVGVVDLQAGDALAGQLVDLPLQPLPGERVAQPPVERHLPVARPAGWRSRAGRPGPRPGSGSRWREAGGGGTFFGSPKSRSPARAGTPRRKAMRPARTRSPVSCPPDTDRALLWCAAPHLTPRAELGAFCIAQRGRPDGPRSCRPFMPAAGHKQLLIRELRGCPVARLRFPSGERPVLGRMRLRWALLGGRLPRFQ